MKKSQVFAALALAMALGVVAPVAGVVSNFASAYSAVEEKATEGDVDTVVSAVEADSVYGLMKDLGALYAKRSQVTEFDDDLAAAIVDAANAIDSNITVIEGIASGAKATAAETQSVIDKVTTLPSIVGGYNIYRAIYDAIAKKDNGALKVAIDEYNNSTYRGNNSAISTDNLTYNNIVTSNINDYNLYVALFTAVANAQTNLDKYNADVNAWTSLLSTAGLLNENGQDKYDALFDEDAGDVKVDDLVKLYSSANFNENYNPTNWVNVRTAVAGADEAVEGNYQKNYSIIIAIADAYRIATGSKSTTAQVAAQLVAYTAPETPSENPTETPDDGKEDDKAGETDKNGAPNTGVLSTAEGTAAASAGIMAAVATALTAAGVGVVAFRNARRKNA